MYTFLALLALITVYFILCLRIVKENQRGIKVLFGKPRKTFTSGLRFIWWPFEKFVIYPTTQQEIEIKDVKLVTMAKKYEGEKHGAAGITLDASVYFFWPKDLFSPVVNGPDPQSPENIFNFFEETISDALRSVAGKMTWREVIQERKKLTEGICNILKNGTVISDPKTNSSDSFTQENPFQKSGITELYAVIKEINLPPALNEAITAPEIARLKADARESEGSGERRYLTAVGEGKKAARAAEGKGEAAARKAIFDAIEAAGEKGLAKEALLSLREMAKGTSNTILFGLPPQLYEGLADAMGGKRPEELFKLLSKEQAEKLIELLSKKIGE